LETLYLIMTHMTHRALSKTLLTVNSFGSGIQFLKNSPSGSRKTEKVLEIRASAAKSEKRCSTIPS